MGAVLEVYLELETEPGEWLATPLCKDGFPESVGFANKHRELFSFLGFGSADQYEFRDFAPAFRGLPNDLSPQMRCYLDQVWGEDIPCFTWLKLADLQEIAHEFRICFGYVSSELAPLFGDGLQPYPSQQIRHGIPSPKARPTMTKFHGYYKIEVIWVEPFREMFGSFFGDLMARMERLGPAEQVRAIFEFTF
ncbi:MAG: hypothetical protein F6J87_18215 [Spirulina sp. SIO3F2]|nr:hypothetical protein [Spirulina sp. SIO3F2]